MLTADELREILDYDLDTGWFTWKQDRRQMRAGSIAGTIQNSGYWSIGIDFKRYLAHRLAWLYVHGRWPKDQIDHIDGDRLNNGIINLREATAFGNARNAKVRSDNLMGVKGIRKNKYGAYSARLTHKGKTLYLGYFSNLNEAVNVLSAKRKELHGEFSIGRRS